jgi:hypothetical protein
MSARLVLAVLAFFSSLLLFLFSSLMQKRSTTFALICAKHGWVDPDAKAHAMKMAAIMYLGAGLVALFGELVWGWFFKTPTGIALQRGWRRMMTTISKTLFGHRKDNYIKSSDNSSDDENGREMSGSQDHQNYHHRRTRSGNRRINSGSGSGSDYFDTMRLTSTREVNNGINVPSAIASSNY